MTFKVIVMRGWVSFSYLCLNLLVLVKSIKILLLPCMFNVLFYHCFKSCFDGVSFKLVYTGSLLYKRDRIFLKHFA